MAKSRMMRVDDSLYEQIKQMSDEEDRSILSMTRELSKTLTLLKRKKGQGFDIITALILIVTFIITGVAVFNLLPQLFQTTGLSTLINQSAAGNTTVQAVTNIQQSGLDNYVLTVYILMHIIVILLGAFVGANAIALGINILFGLLSITVAIVFGNSIATFITATGWSTYIPTTMWILNNLPLAEAGWFFITIIIMFAGRSKGI